MSFDVTTDWHGFYPVYIDDINHKTYVCRIKAQDYNYTNVILNEPTPTETGHTIGIDLSQAAKDKLNLASTLNTMLSLQENGHVTQLEINDLLRIKRGASNTTIAEIDSGTVWFKKKTFINDELQVATSADNISFFSVNNKISIK